MDTSEKAQIEREIRAQIVRRMRVKQGLQWHVVVFMLVNLALVAINLRYTPNTLWCLWPLGAWGSAVLLHAYAVLGGGSSDEAAIQAQIREEMARRGLT